MKEVVLGVLFDFLIVVVGVLVDAVILELGEVFDRVKFVDHVGRE